MKPGPKPKPNAIKQFQGSQHYNNSEPNIKKLTVFPDPPKQINKNGKDFWWEYGPALAEAGVLKVTDLPAFEMLCFWYGVYSIARGKIGATGKGLIYKAEDSNYEQQSAQYNICKQAIKEFKSLATEFGLTPSSRGMLHVDVEIPISPEMRNVDLIAELKGRR